MIGAQVSTHWCGTGTWTMPFIRAVDGRSWERRVDWSDSARTCSRAPEQFGPVVIRVGA